MLPTIPAVAKNIFRAVNPMTFINRRNESLIENEISEINELLEKAVQNNKGFPLNFIKNATLKGIVAGELQKYSLINLSQHSLPGLDFKFFYTINFANNWRLRAINHILDLNSKIDTIQANFNQVIAQKPALGLTAYIQSGEKFIPESFYNNEIDRLYPLRSIQMMANDAPTGRKMEFQYLNPETMTNYEDAIVEVRNAFEWAESGGVDRERCKGRPLNACIAPCQWDEEADDGPECLPDPMLDKWYYELICNAMHNDPKLYRKDLIKLAEVYNVEPSDIVPGKQNWDGIGRDYLCKKLAEFNKELVFKYTPQQDPDELLKNISSDMSIRIEHLQEALQIARNNQGPGIFTKMKENLMNHYPKIVAVIVVLMLLTGIVIPFFPLDDLKKTGQHIQRKETDIDARKQMKDQFRAENPIQAVTSEFNEKEKTDFYATKYSVEKSIVDWGEEKLSQLRHQYEGQEKNEDNQILEDLESMRSSPISMYPRVRVERFYLQEMENILNERGLSDFIIDEMRNQLGILYKQYPGRWDSLYNKYSFEEINPVRYLIYLMLKDEANNLAAAVRAYQHVEYIIKNYPPDLLKKIIRSHVPLLVTPENYAVAQGELISKGKFHQRAALQHDYDDDGRFN